jgi:hypothetical protein
MPDYSGFMAVICHRWIDEAKGWRCVLERGHAGPCRHEWTPPERIEPRQ